MDIATHKLSGRFRLSQSIMAYSWFYSIYWLVYSYHHGNPSAVILLRLVEALHQSAQRREISFSTSYIVSPDPSKYRHFSGSNATCSMLLYGIFWLAAAGSITSSIPSNCRAVENCQQAQAAAAFAWFTEYVYSPKMIALISNTVLESAL